MQNSIVRVWLLAASMAALTSTIVFAHGGATGIVGERMMGMMMLGEQMKVLAPAIAVAEPDKNVVVEAAGMITMHAGPAMTNLFPEGSTESPSEALPAIWERWDEFIGYAEELSRLADELKFVATNLSQDDAQDAVVDQRPASDWERLEFAALMGLSTTTAMASGESASEALPAAPPSRSAAVVFAEIAETCSACHATFRR